MLGFPCQQPEQPQGLKYVRIKANKFPEQFLFETTKEIFFFSFCFYFLLEPEDFSLNE